MKDIENNEELKEYVQEHFPEFKEIGERLMNKLQSLRGEEGKERKEIAYCSITDDGIKKISDLLRYHPCPNEYLRYNEMHKNEKEELPDKQPSYKKVRDRYINYLKKENEQENKEESKVLAADIERSVSEKSKKAESDSKSVSEIGDENDVLAKDDAKTSKTVYKDAKNKKNPVNSEPNIDRDSLGFHDETSNNGDSQMPQNPDRDERRLEDEEDSGTAESNAGKFDYPLPQENKGADPRPPIILPNPSGLSSGVKTETLNNMSFSHHDHNELSSSQSVISV